MKWTRAPQTGEQVAKLYAEGKTPAQIAAALSCHVSTVYRWLNRMVAEGKIRPLDERSA